MNLTNKFTSNQMNVFTEFSVSVLTAIFQENLG